MKKINFVEKYEDELNQYFAEEVATEILDDDLEDAFNNWVEETDLKDLEKIIYGDLAISDDGQFVGTHQQFENSRIK